MDLGVGIGLGTVGNDLLSPVEYEKKFTERLISIWRTRGDS